MLVTTCSSAVPEDAISQSSSSSSSSKAAKQLAAQKKPLVTWVCPPIARDGTAKTTSPVDGVVVSRPQPKSTRPCHYRVSAYPRAASKKRQRFKLAPPLAKVLAPARGASSSKTSIEAALLPRDASFTKDAVVAAVAAYCEPLERDPRDLKRIVCDSPLRAALGVDAFEFSRLDALLAPLLLPPEPLVIDYAVPGGDAPQPRGLREPATLDVKVDLPLGLVAASPSQQQQQNVGSPRVLSESSSSSSALLRLERLCARAIAHRRLEPARPVSPWDGLVDDLCGGDASSGASNEDHAALRHALVAAAQPPQSLGGPLPQARHAGGRGALSTPTLPNPTTTLPVVVGGPPPPLPLPRAGAPSSSSSLPPPPGVGGPR
mmetsp:Transcript_4793/g.19540  ORF Transcript_4793/g.19540 Transcript_4793/m.19540 type:complete len:375 (-) Transcript_4793:2132-3256(-)